MGVQVTITLSEELSQRIERVAKMLGKPFDEILVAMLENGLPSREIAAIPSMTSLTDDEVLEFANRQMDQYQLEQLNELLERQQMADLNYWDRIYLHGLRQIQIFVSISKQQGRAEALTRGILSN